MDDHMHSGQAGLATEIPRCPINVAARRSGLSAHVIRAWERRYSAITPDRTLKARRLYSDWEIRRLVLLRQSVELGHRIGEIARLPLEELRSLVGRETIPAVEASPRIPLPRQRLLEVTLDAVRALDGASLSQWLLQSTRSLIVPDLFDEYLDVLGTQISDLVRAGKLRVAHERFATIFIRSFLGDLLACSGASPWTASLVITTPTGYAREIGAMMAAVTASHSGWDAIYAGPALPIDDLAFIARQRNARAALLSVPAIADGASIDSELRQLRAGLGDGPVILCMGAQSIVSAPVLQATGARQASSYRELTHHLEEIMRV